jgi:hypothetical protein
MRSPDMGISVSTDGVRTLVIGEEEDEVGEAFLPLFQAAVMELGHHAHVVIHLKINGGLLEVLCCFRRPGECFKIQTEIEMGVAKLIPKDDTVGIPPGCAENLLRRAFPCEELVHFLHGHA